MAHDKGFLVCENKSFVAGMSKEELVLSFSSIAKHEEVGKFIDGDGVERTVMHYCSGKVNLSDLTYDKDHYSIYNAILTNDKIEVVKIDCVGVYKKQEQAFNATYSENVKVSFQLSESTHGQRSYSLYIYCNEGSYNNVLINLYYIK